MSTVVSFKHSGIRLVSLSAQTRSKNLDPKGTTMYRQWVLYLVVSEVTVMLESKICCWFPPENFDKDLATVTKKKKKKEYLTACETP